MDRDGFLILAGRAGRIPAATGLPGGYVAIPILSP